MTDVIEGWVRENPGQWLWMHRRWRPDMLPKAAPKGGLPSQGNVTSQAETTAL